MALSIAGSDPSGGAGLQADLKTFHRMGVYGEAVVTLITVQNTRGLRRVEVLAADLVAEQIHAVITDIPPKAAKTGALGNLAVVEAVALAAEGFAFPLVVDPVMLSTNGVALMDADARSAFAQKLLPRAFLLTPNLDEASELTGIADRCATGCCFRGSTELPSPLERLWYGCEWSRPAAARAFTPAASPPDFLNFTSPASISPNRFSAALSNRPTGVSRP